MIYCNAESNPSKKDEPIEDELQKLPEDVLQEDTDEDEDDLEDIEDDEAVEEEE